MIPTFKNKNNKQPSWFDSGEAYIKNRLQETRPHYLTIPAVLEVCYKAADFNFYIKQYEVGILHEEDGTRRYEPRDGWVNNYAGIHSVNSAEDARNNNRIALDLIEQDIEDGCTAFSIQLKEVEFI